MPLFPRRLDSFSWWFPLQGWSPLSDSLKALNRVLPTCRLVQPVNKPLCWDFYRWLTLLLHIHLSRLALQEPFMIVRLLKWGVHCSRWGHYSQGSNYRSRAEKQGASDLATATHSIQVPMCTFNTPNRKDKDECIHQLLALHHFLPNHHTAGRFWKKQEESTLQCHHFPWISETYMICIVEGRSETII